VTSITREVRQHHGHLQCLLNNLGIETMQWLNFNRAKIEFTTLTKGKKAGEWVAEE
jgi:hypothetical protein